MSAKLHEAVHRTANKLLDDPEYVELPRDISEELEMRLLSALGRLGYVRRNPSPGERSRFVAWDTEARTWSSRDRTGSPTWLVHPAARKYFKRYGEQYVQLLEATERLTQ